MVLTGHVGAVRAVAFSVDGELLISGDDGGSVNVWSLADLGRPHRVATYAGLGRVWAVRRGDDGLSVAADASGGVKVWRLADRVGATWGGVTLPASASRRAGRSQQVTAVGFSPDGQLVVVGDTGAPRRCGGCRSVRTATPRRARRRRVT